MMIDINKVLVEDRIRKDFGNIEELAADIKENGLINPPVVDPDYRLIAGERRLRACKSLGWNQIEVRIVPVRDANHALEMEISENEQRKDFTTLERYEMFKRRYEYLQNLQIPGRIQHKAATEAGISENTVKQVETILDNQGKLTEEEFQSWATGSTTTAEAYRKVQSELEAAKNREAGYQLKLQKARERLEDANEQLAQQPKEVVKEVVKRVEVKPADYDQAKQRAADAEREVKRLGNDAVTLRKQLDEATEKLSKLSKTTGNRDVVVELERDCISCCRKVELLVKDVGGFAYLASRFYDLSKDKQELYRKSFEIMYAMAQNVLNVIGG